MTGSQVGRNDPCPCGSGKKHKKCHGMVLRTTSTLDQHKLHGKTLTPPLLGVPKLQPMHWMDERLPEVLWAALIVAHFPRDYALSVFRKVAGYISELHDEASTGDVTFSALAELPPQKLEDFLTEEAGKPPTSIALETLEHLANEDVWQEFLPIKLGHWVGSDLWRMSIDAGVKDDYDRYYAWTSTYSHCHWGAIRETVFDTCGNPLHRLHRIPREGPFTLPDVVPDACEVVDKILSLVSQAYPRFEFRTTVK